ncbi:phosphate ABC transporter substrate-binding/OmpA family protein [Peristeroidobacter soli]|uniref:phosphate ABC transporter substrate-binding/OmpA family protein n=1 Tax=Peristeroidobacter soli TaxID=2497877 RepID=UPI0013003BFA|nr:phosphate ABC transporter substrate-binding/OmpA family protein [Peristeroidobacter soli]
MSNLKSRLIQRGSAAGNIITVVLLVGIIGLGVYLWLGKKGGDGAESASTSGTPTSQAAGKAKSNDGGAPTPIEPVTGTPPLDAAATYVPKDNVLQIDISEYAGYGGLIVANGGLEPNPDSIFAKEYGFKVKITKSEGETWSALNNGRLAATATTTDALAVLGRQFDAVVPVQIGYSRGADMVVVDRGVASVNQLAGKVLAASQFNESEFFIRYLAQEAGVPVTVLRDLDSKPSSSELGLVFYDDASIACKAYEHELAGSQRLNGCVGWTPFTDEVVEGSNGAAKVLVSNRNLLVIADVLAVNGGFARANPDMVRGLVHGILEGNRRLRDQQAANIGIVAKAFGWSDADARDELSRVHLANLPENRAFFSGTIDSAGSFGGIFQSSVLAYGSVIKNPTDASRFADVTALDALAKKGLFADQTIAIAPIKTSTQASLEGDPLLSKDIRFFFEANSAKLDKTEIKNQEYLDTIKRFLQVSPGSTVLLRGHVDNARVNEFRDQGGEQLVKSMALKAMELSRQRALAVSEALRARHKDIDPSRIEAVGRGWEEPAGPNSELNRRVEVQWFTLE